MSRGNLPFPSLVVARRWIGTPRNVPPGTAFILVLVLALGLFPALALAQDGITLSVVPSVDCGNASFGVTVGGGTGPYDLSWDFGDEVTLDEADVGSFPHFTLHTYLGPGDYDWSLNASDSGEPVNQASASGMLTIEGPMVTLAADETRPVLVDGQAVVNLRAAVIGGMGPFTYQWDFGDGSGALNGEPEVVHTYTAAGQFTAQVTVTDACGFSDTDSVTITVVTCHPMAQRIADAVSSLFPARATQEYTCEEIYAIFRGALSGTQVGFGRMWHAYQLTQIIQDLTWEAIRDWHLDGNGWGLLLQLNRFAELLEDFSSEDLMALLEGDVRIQDIRHAVRMVTRFGADFQDALARLSEDGVSPGQVNQFYRLAQELDMENEVLDAYLAGGVTLADIRHAAHGFGEDWETALSARAEGRGWGEINQAFRLAGEEGDPQTILRTGVQEFRRQEREETQTQRRSERDGDTAAHIADQYGVSQDEVTDLYYTTCGQDWQCVRDHYRGQQGQPGGGRGRH